MVMLLAGVGPALGATEAATIVATCATCHRPDPLPNALSNETAAIPPIDGQPAGDLVHRLRELERDAAETVMGRIAGALTEAEKTAVADQLSRSKSP